MHDPKAQQSDATLMARVNRGETDCFAELVRRYQPALVRVAASRLGRADWAEDVVQETFLAAFKSCASYDPRFGFRTWLWTILLNQCHGHYQRRARSLPVEPLTGELEQSVGQGSDEHRESSPLAELLAKERAAQLEALLAQLTLAQADALRLRFFGGLKFHEIAETMQCSLSTAKNRVRFGLTRMAELLEAAGAPATRRGQREQDP
ncbi:MAG: sigma-70 family RNA polymerase sigma factor [Pirellulales bacterium]